MNIILVSWEFFARVNLHHSYLTISILPRSIIVNVPTHLEIRALKEFRDKAKLTGVAAKSRSEHHIPLSTSRILEISG